MRIYIAGPYTAPTEKEMVGNVALAIAAGIAVFKKGHTPFIPHLSHYVDKYATHHDIPMEYEDYMKWDNVWLKECNAILVLAESPGVLEEIRVARMYDLRFFYSVAEIENVKS